MKSVVEVLQFGEGDFGDDYSPPHESPTQDKETITDGRIEIGGVYEDDLEGNGSGATLLSLPINYDRPITTPNWRGLSNLAKEFANILLYAVNRFL